MSKGSLRLNFDFTKLPQNIVILKETDVDQECNKKEKKKEIPKHVAFCLLKSRLLKHFWNESESER